MKSGYSYICPGEEKSNKKMTRGQMWDTWWRQKIRDFLIT